VRMVDGYERLYRSLVGSAFGPRPVPVSKNAGSFLDDPCHECLTNLMHPKSVAENSFRGSPEAFGFLASNQHSICSVAISYPRIGSVSPSRINETSQVEIGPRISRSYNRPLSRHDIDRRGEERRLGG
jgi:hypothetical protein